MQVVEFTTPEDPKAARLVGLVDFLKSLNHSKPISKETFMRLAGQLGIVITKDNIQNLMQQEPLLNLFEPMDPQSNMLVFKGEDQAVSGMPVDQAQNIVAKMAKRANPLG